MKSSNLVYPYIANSVPAVREEMLTEIGVMDVEELLSVIPDRLRLKRALDLPSPLFAESELRKHIEEVLSKNTTCKEYLNFLGAGCSQHSVPAVCDEIAHRAEFLTAYAGFAYTDLGKWQAFFEFQSMMGELLEMDVVSLPTYDSATAVGFALRMASRITGRNEVLIPKTIGHEKLSVVRNLCQPETMPGHIEVKLVDYDQERGTIDLVDLERKLSSKTAAVYFENPSYLGFVSEGKEISDIAHENGAECVVGVDPISLGVLSPPAQYGADIVCGDIQPLGIHMEYGGLAGFIASRERYLPEYPLQVAGIARTLRKGEFGFGYITHERTLYVEREKGKDFTGTTVCLWAIVAAVYLALMGPEGMREIGQAIIQKSHYAAELLSKISGVRILFSPHFFKEFVVNFDGTGHTVNNVNKQLLKYGIFGGKDLTREFPELGNSALYCVTEIHTKNDLQKLTNALKEILK